MKVGILSDIHGNLEALEAVLDRFRQEGVERIWCLGDIVGYGADPNECCARIRNAADTVVLGNHDAACTGSEDIAHFNTWAREAILWTARELAEEHRAWLRGLPLTVTIEDTLLVHASPFEPARWHYVHTRMKTVDMARGFDATEARCTFVGHSHQQMVLVRRRTDGRDECSLVPRRGFQMEDGQRYLVNVGSTGQPRDGDPRAAFALYDPGGGTVALERVSYDVAAAQRKIRASGLPEILAERLETGS